MSNKKAKTTMTQEYDYSEFQSKVGDNLLARLSGLALDQKKAEAEVARLEEELKKAQANLRDIAEHQIPSLMEEVGMKEFITEEGVKIKVVEKIRGSIPEANAEKAFAWLEKMEYDNIVKREFKITFGKEEEDWARKFESDLKKRKKKLNFVVKRGIHPSTLASFVSELLKEGVDIPLDLFGVYRQRLSKIEYK